jgi:hypothetical protein
MNSQRDEETKALLLGEDGIDVPPKMDKHGAAGMEKTVSSRTVYLICFFLLLLNVGLIGASWRAQGEIKALYAFMGRDITSLPRPDPFVGLSEASKSHPAGEEFAFFASE